MAIKTSLSSIYFTSYRSMVGPFLSYLSLLSRSIYKQEITWNAHRILLRRPLRTGWIFHDYNNEQQLPETSRQQRYMKGDWMKDIEWRKELNKEARERAEWEIGKWRKMGAVRFYCSGMNLHYACVYVVWLNVVAVVVKTHSTDGRCTSICFIRRCGIRITQCLYV